MKKTMIILAMIGFAAVNGYSQDKNCCCCNCKKKVAVHHHAVHKKAKTDNKTDNTESIGLLWMPVQTWQTTWNVVAYNPPVKKVCVFDNNGDMNYIADTSYLGYYPVSNNTAPKCDDIEAMLAPRYQDMVVTSTAFTDDGVIPAKYTCEGEQTSPPLSIANIPNGTQSLAVVMYDPHSTAKGSTAYWLMWDIGVNTIANNTADNNGNMSVYNMPENFVNDHAARNPESMQYGYQAICPLAGTHYYHFKVYALDTKLMLDKNTSQLIPEKAMAGHVLAKGEITGVFNRHLD